MNRIVGIGACVADTLITVPFYPPEDTKLRAEHSKTAGGGPTATGLVAAQKLGESCAFIGNLSNDGSGRFLKEDFEKYGVDTDYITVLDGFSSFCSVIWLSRQTTSRTIVFDKGNLPALVLNEQQKAAIQAAELLMLDGNELEAAVEAATLAKQSGTTVLYDAGGLYDGIERLLPLVDILIPSKEFALSATGCPTVEKAAEALYTIYKPRVVVITCGKDGGVLYDGQQVLSYPCYPAVVVDSNGAGDVFHGAFAAGLVKGFSFETCCHFASAVSGLKCTGIGARESVPDFNTVKQYLKENHYEL